jgi:hypothetical protein
MSIHPLLRLAATHPQLLADHAAAYAELVGDEMGKTLSAWKRTVLFNALGVGLLLVGTLLTGVALMLWALIPVPDDRAYWALIAVPAIPAAVALLCLLAGRQPVAGAFAEVKQQLAHDLVMLREVSTSAGSS